MSLEIERKFLVTGEFIQFAYKSERITQAYLSSNSSRSVRIRRKGDKAYITIKGKSSEDGTTRVEWEKEISIADAELLFPLCEDGMIDKTRYYIKNNENVFEVDVFHGENKGLCMAEIELGSAAQIFEKPGWLGQEVTGDDRYYNSQLVKHPFSKWKTND